MLSPLHHFSYRRLSVLICLQTPVSFSSCFLHLTESFSAALLSLQHSSFMFLVPVYPPRFFHAFLHQSSRSQLVYLYLDRVISRRTTPYIFKLFPLLPMSSICLIYAAHAFFLGCHLCPCGPRSSLVELAKYSSLGARGLQCISAISCCVAFPTQRAGSLQCFLA